MDTSLVTLSPPNPSSNIVTNELSGENASQFNSKDHEASEQLNSIHNDQYVSSNTADTGGEGVHMENFRILNLR